jgi:hypothetical protein
MIPNRTWQQFKAAYPNLSLDEAKRKYSDERKRFDQQEQFVNSGLFMKGMRNV